MVSVQERRDWLIHGIRAHVLPALVEQGFTIAPLVHHGPVDRKFQLSFPSWGRLMRTRNSGVDLIEIQLAPYRRAAFRMNAGVVPGDGIVTMAGHRPIEEVAVHWLREYFETHARPLLRQSLKAVGLEPLGGWFSVRCWPWQTPEQGDYEKLARWVVGLLPELDVALREGRVGRHVRRVVIPRSVRVTHERNT